MNPNGLLALALMASAWGAGYALAHGQRIVAAALTLLAGFCLGAVLDRLGR